MAGSATIVLAALAASATGVIGGCGASDAGPAACTSDRSCQDGDPCDGLERCVLGVCAPGEAPACASGTACWAGSCVAAPPTAGPAGCPVPHAPVVAVLPAGFRLGFADAGAVEVGLAAAPGAEPVSWSDDGAVGVSAVGAAAEVVARWKAPPKRCLEAMFRQTYAIGAASDEVGIAAADPRITAWAGGFRDIREGAGVDAAWSDPTYALGPAGEDVYDVLALGEGGVGTFILEAPASDRPGPDLAVFENATPPTFHEFAFVEVSSDGIHFVRFPSWSAVPGPVGAYDMTDATQVQGLAGTQPLGVGTPFDLASVRFEPEVTSGLVDLQAIRFVRIVDIVGDGRARDSFGQPIYDPTPTIGSAGFDLDAIAVLGAVLGGD